jgi:hypothetical protein
MRQNADEAAPRKCREGKFIRFVAPSLPFAINAGKNFPLTKRVGGVQFGELVYEEIKIRRKPRNITYPLYTLIVPERRGTRGHGRHINKHSHIDAIPSEEGAEMEASNPYQLNIGMPW